MASGANKWRRKKGTRSIGQNRTIIIFLLASLQKPNDYLGLVEGGIGGLGPTVGKVNLQQVYTGSSSTNWNSTTSNHPGIGNKSARRPRKKLSLSC